MHRAYVSCSIRLYHRARMLFTAVNNADLWSVLRVDLPYSRGSDSCRREWISL